MKRCLKSIILTAMLCAVVFSQSGNEPDIRRRLEMIERGQEETVRAELPTLMTQYQNHPGVLYLQAVLTTNGSDAAKMYQNIVDNFPRSEWADDALYKLYQYYYSIGLYKTAEQKLQQLKQEYPFSAYATDQAPLTDVSLQQPEEEKAGKSNGTMETKKDLDTRREIKEYQTPKESHPYPPRYSTAFTVQVGAFSTMQNAEELKTRFEQEGYQCNIFTMVSNGRKLHKVWVGEYKTQNEAREVIQQIKEKFGLSAIVVSR